MCIRDRGTFELVIKHYNDGKMSSHLFSLKPNDVVSFKGPIKKWQWVPNSFKSITLLGAGTGTTPLYQLASHIARNPEDKTKINVFYGNKTSSDILLKKEWNELQEKYPDQVKVTYFVDKLDDGKENGVELGFISKEFIAKNAPGPKEDTHLFICGPPPFMKAYSGEKAKPTDQGELTGLLQELGYSKDQVFKF